MNNDVPSSSRNWAFGAQLSGMLAGYLIPFGNILGPLIIWLMKKDEDDFVARHALEAMNFQISVLLAVLLCIPLVFVIVGLPLLIVICIGQLVLGIIACIAAMSGEEYRYPYSFRFVNG